MSHIRSDIFGAFCSTIDSSNGRLFNPASKSDRVIDREATLFAKRVETLLEYLLENGLEDMTLNELYNEISGRPV